VGQLAVRDLCDLRRRWDNRINGPRRAGEINYQFMAHCGRCGFGKDIERYSGKGDWKDDAEVFVEILPSGQRYSDLASDYCQTQFGWNDAPDDFEGFF